jgi:hypothetical protein
MARVVISTGLVLAVSQSAYAQFTTYQGGAGTESSWRAAASALIGGAPVPLEDFELYRGVPSPFSGPSDQVRTLPALGVDLFGDAPGTYPGVYSNDGQAHSGSNQLANFGGGGGNASDYHIRPAAGRVVLALGFWQCDPQGDQVMQAFDADDNLIGTIVGRINNGSGQSFAGFVSQSPIMRVRVVGLEGDGWNHLDDLQIVTVPLCGTSDFNGDGDYGTDADIEAFFACLAGNCCAACFPGGSDFNGDGDSGTDADIEAFFRVLAGGSC